MQPTKSLLVVVILLVVYIILKWTYRLIFGLLDYALLIGMIAGIAWYMRLSRNRKKALHRKIKAFIKSITQALR